MKIIIQSAIKTLNKTEYILSNISNEIFCDTTIPPYNSSIGSHIRHVLDFYDCILKDSSKIDLIARKRNLEIEQNCKNALDYYNEIIEKLGALNEDDLEKIVFVTDDLGLGKTVIKYTFSALMAQANSHTIHHYAIINYILDGLGNSLKDDTFGYNPTTPKVKNFN
ncbi:DinB family protein [Formosa maritima]|uniref:DinB family protein n=1 Tax=Formosa maritima TaxID=2592046 RepID=A0A5D0GHC6_9FLAO|nr:hypothetical protein [Formosa maritima]TYA57227.1 hypothetical protein FVF61_04785 [Formosa maritima]